MKPTISGERISEKSDKFLSTYPISRYFSRISSNRSLGKEVHCNCTKRAYAGTGKQIVEELASKLRKWLRREGYAAFY